MSGHVVLGLRVQANVVTTPLTDYIIEANRTLVSRQFELDVWSKQLEAKCLFYLHPHSTPSPSHTLPPSLLLISRALEVHEKLAFIPPALAFVRTKQKTFGRTLQGRAEPHEVKQTETNQNQKRAPFDPLKATTAGGSKEEDAAAPGSPGHHRCFAAFVEKVFFSSLSLGCGASKAVGETAAE
ncbi:hypothetical protein HPB51_001679 [Rhipicephalus microplus]|uniref:Uncharacterized protein n=1 Tax=Rhipicephalus microplus TaxID=6941 RepID=A0A9J6EVY9_RHIMP|nr:hypothetical protein HPB51_001679 [Rhipicephalus microplus]